MGVIWKSGGGYIVGTDGGIFNCSTIKTRPIDHVYDLACVDYTTASYEDFIFKGAKSEGAKLWFAPNATPIATDCPVLARGDSEWAPSCMHFMPSEFVMHRPFEVNLVYKPR